MTKIEDYWGYLEKVPESERAETEAAMETWIAGRAAVMDRHADTVASADGVIAAVLALHSPYMGWWFARSLHFDYAPSCTGCSAESSHGCSAGWQCATYELVQSG